MGLFFWIFVAVGAVAFIALWRNNWDLAKAWESVVIFAGAVVAAAVALFHGGTSP